MKKISLLLLCLIIYSVSALYAKVEINGETYEVFDPHLHVGEVGAVPLSAKKFFTEFLFMGVPYIPAIIGKVTDPYGDFIGIKGNMEIGGIDRAVILAVYSMDTTGYATNSELEGYLTDERNADSQGDPVFWGMASINFEDFDDEEIRSARLEAVESYFKQRPDLFIGLKLAHAHQGIAFNDSRYYDVFEIAAKYSVPVLLHTGFSPFPGSKDTPEYYDPAYLEDIISNYDGVDEKGDPNDEKIVNFVFAHAGQGDKRSVLSALSMAEKHQNIYLDLSALKRAFLIDENGNEVPEGEEESVEGYDKDLGQIPFVLQEIKNRNLIDRAFFATDGPQYSGMLKSYLSSFIKGIEKVGFTKEEIEKLLYKNADKLYLKR
jgi:uncharacterized protein